MMEAEKAPLAAPTAMPLSGEHPHVDTEAMFALSHDLPVELRREAHALINSLKNNQGISQAFDAFCTSAFARPDQVPGASRFLSEVFAQREDLLADMARVSDLIIELTCSQFSLTLCVAARWAARGDTARLTKLAESMMAAHSKISHPGAVEIMLAITTSLAITRNARAEQLFQVALPLATDDQAEAVAEARLWLAAGRTVRAAHQEIRDLWDHRLRRPRHLWTWEAREERDALAVLADQLSIGAEGTSLFKSIVPLCWWELAMKRARERDDNPPAAPDDDPVDSLPPPLKPFLSEEPDVDEPPQIDMGMVPFLLGGVVGAITMAVVIWLVPFVTEKAAMLAPPAKATPSSR